MSDEERLVKTRPTGRDRARGLVSSRASGARIDARTYAPPEDLAAYVAAYWVGQWELEDQPPHVTELLGDPCMHLSFEVGDGESGARVVGVWNDLWIRELAGRGRVRGVKLRPGACRAFAEVSATDLSNRKTPWADVFGRAEDLEIAERMLDHDLDSSESDDERAYAAMSGWLRARLRPGFDDLDDVRLAIALAERAARDTSMLTVESLADVGGLSVRALQRLFRLHVGAAPKWVIRRARLQEVASRLEAGNATSLAQLAADLGYTDQAHLARDFKRATGKTPSGFANTVRE